MYDFLDVASDLTQAVALYPRLHPGDTTRPGEQVPLFFGPCLYCGGGYLATLPGKCPRCRTWLRRVVRPPAWALQGIRRYRLWVRVELFRSTCYETLQRALADIVLLNEAQLTLRRERP